MQLAVMFSLIFPALGRNLPASASGQEQSKQGQFIEELAAPSAKVGRP
jgi:hypothetical protein